MERYIIVVTLFVVMILSKSPKVLASIRSWPRSMFNKASPGSGSSRPINRLQNIVEHLRSIENIRECAFDPYNCSSLQSCLTEMNSLKLEDISLDLDDLDLPNLSESVCMNIVATQNFHISLFILPQGCKLPIHDHPSMTVSSKILYGKISVRSFTPQGIASQDSKSKSIKATMDKATRSSDDDAWLLTPELGNVHEFVAVDTSVIFDILLPPYMEPDRPCNYYNIKEVTEAKGAKGVKGAKAVKVKVEVEVDTERRKTDTDTEQHRTYLLTKMIPSEERNIILPYTIPYTGFKPS